MPVEVKTVDPIDQSQPVKPEQDVILSITVGNAQIGGSLVKDSNGNTIAKGEITNLNLGIGSALVGDTISVITNVLDVNPVSNGIAVIDHFTNVSNNYLYADTAPEGGIVSFTRNYTFTSA